MALSEWQSQTEINIHKNRLIWKITLLFQRIKRSQKCSNMTINSKNKIRLLCQKRKRSRQWKKQLLLPVNQSLLTLKRDNQWQSNPLKTRLHLKINKSSTLTIKTTKKSSNNARGNSASIRMSASRCRTTRGSYSLSTKRQRGMEESSLRTVCRYQKVSSKGWLKKSPASIQPVQTRHEFSVESLENCAETEVRSLWSKWKGISARNQSTRGMTHQHHRCMRVHKSRNMA